MYAYYIIYFIKNKIYIIQKLFSSISYIEFINKKHIIVVYVICDSNRWPYMNFINCLCVNNVSITKCK